MHARMKCLILDVDDLHYFDVDISHYYLYPSQ